ncbi:MAG: hypothetical protein RL077_1631 [Verrucomicrobiota bacterium]|jgi:outer membrane receptor protein involved in Fe transport
MKKTHYYKYAASLLLNALTFAQSPTTNSPAPATNPVKLEAFSVTGSRISKVQDATPQPIVEYSGADIANSGYASLGDFLQAQSFNSGGVGNLLQTSVTGVGLAFSRGASSLNLRGLGAGNSLILLNGRRTANHANPDSQGATVFDLKSVPLEAIERVEYLKDGASAIYGSDAITGVMNIILKKQFEGVAVETYFGRANHPPLVLTRSFNVMAGAKNAKTSVLGSVTWFKQDGSLVSDYPRSPSQDFSNLGIKGKNNNSTQNFPGNINLTAAQATAAGLPARAGYYSITGGTPTTNPTLNNISFFGPAASIPASNLNKGGAKSLFPASENWNVLAYLNHDFNDRLSAFFQVIGSRAHTQYVYGPTGARDSTVEVSTSFLTSIPNNPQGGTKNPSLIIPAGNPFNPFRVNLTSFTMLSSPDQPRNFDVVSEAETFLGGLKGKLGHEWTWEASGAYSQDIYTQYQAGSMIANDLQNALNGTLPGALGFFYNPFGPSPKELVSKLYFDSLNLYKSYGYAADFLAAGPLIKMPNLFGATSSGVLSMAVGAEYHKDEIVGRPDSSNLIATNNGFPFYALRTVNSQFIEFDVPVLKQYLELQLAARRESYSDFGITNKLKLAFGSQWTKFFKVRGSYSESFKAPGLSQLYGGGRSGSDPTLDPLNPALPSQKYFKVVRANPSLKPQQGQIYYLGGVVDASKIIANLSFSIDYIDLKISDAIVPISTFTPDQFFKYFPNLVVRNPTNNQIMHFDMTPFNGVAYYYKGYDLGFDYLVKNRTLGKFKVSAQATRVLYLASDPGIGTGIQDFTGRYGFGGEVQKWTGNASLGWIYGKFNSTVSALVKGQCLQDASGTLAANTAWYINPIALFNATTTYQGPWNTSITLACNNLLNTEPPPDGVLRPYAGFDVASYGAWGMGRFVSIKLKKKF